MRDGRDPQGRSRETLRLLGAGMIWTRGEERGGGPQGSDVSPIEHDDRQRCARGKPGLAALAHVHLDGPAGATIAICLALR